MGLTVAAFRKGRTIIYFFPGFESLLSNPMFFQTWDSGHPGARDPLFCAKTPRGAVGGAYRVLQGA